MPRTAVAQPSVQVSSTTQYCVHPLARVEKTVIEGKDSWAAFHLVSRRKFVLSRKLLLVLASFISASTVPLSFKRLSKLGVVETKQEHQRAIDRLRNVELIVAAESPETRWAIERLEKWRRRGWAEAALYHLASFDYPFEDYARDGRARDQDRMRAYTKYGLDTDRYLSRGSRQGEAQCPQLPGALDELAMPLADALHAIHEVPEPRGDLGAHQLATLMSVGFGKLRGRRVVKDGSRAELLRKTSPSGGARHPTEGYAVAMEVKGLDAGLYHFSVGSNALSWITDLGTHDPLDIFPGLRRAPFRPSALIAMTSVFERNMYRYREPRTFRTVFMDLGHLCSTIQLAAASLKRPTFAHHYIQDDRFEQLIGAHPLEEGVTYAIAVG